MSDQRGAAEVHAETIGKAHEFVPGLGGPQGVVAVHLGGLGKGEGVVPFTRIAVVHFFDDVAAGGGKGGGRSPREMGGECYREKTDEEYSTHFG